MKINKLSVLHVVDSDTKFSGTMFLEVESTENFSESFLPFWVKRYLGYPDEVIIDQDPQFQSKQFHSLIAAADISRRDAGVEIHNALGETERYHAYLQNIFERIKSENPTIDRNTILQLSVKSCNDTAGPSGLVPTFLVFGVVPRMPVHP